MGTLFHLFGDSLAEQMTARRHVYRHAPLLQDALIDLHTARLRDDVLHSTVRIDQRMVDDLVGLETEATALVEGSHLYRPTMDLSRVILPEEQKQLILETITGFPAFSSRPAGAISTSGSNTACGLVSSFTGLVGVERPLWPMHWPVIWDNASYW